MSPRKNEFRLRPKLATADESVLITLQTVPGIGDTKARALLQRFHCVFLFFLLSSVSAFIASVHLCALNDLMTFDL